MKRGKKSGARDRRSEVGERLQSLPAVLPVGQCGGVGVSLVKERICEINIFLDNVTH